MVRQFVSSSDLRSVGYEDGVLEIEFHSGGIYQYFNVPPVVVSELMSAPSHGRYFYSVIRNRYSYRRIC